MPDVKNIAFSFVTIVVVPLLFFVLLELGLIVAGVGTSFDYFNEIDIDGQPHFQENPDFADQFYPPSLNIGPVENTFAAERSAELTRVFVLGGSAALGFPHKNHGFDRLLEAQLRAALPSRKIEVINLAMTSVNSHVMYAVAKSLPEDSADFAVILMGNNEVVGPYGPGTFNQNFLGNISLIRGLQALKRTRIWQALSGLMQQIRPTDAMQDLEWEGMQMFTNNGVPHDDPRMDGVYSHYENNLADIIEALRSKGMHVVLSSVPVNLRHSAPFLSLRGPDLSDEQVDQWRMMTRRGAESADAQNWGDAVTHFQAALEIDPEYADTHFRLATAYENLGEFENAKGHYERALDLDALRFRADTRINQTIQEMAAGAEGDAFSFVDSAAAFEQSSQPFQPGWNLLLEHVHYDFAGNHVIAAELSRTIVSNITGTDTFEPLPGPEIARRVGFPNHDTVAEIQNLQGMIQHPPFPGQSNYAELAAFLDGKVERVTGAVGSPADVIQKRQNIVRSGLADWKIYFELAVLNQRMRNPTATYYHLNQILELYPHNRESYMKIAQAMSEDGKWSEVIPYLEQSLYYTRGDEEKIAETLGWLGTAYLRTGDYETATDLLLEVTEEYSDQIGLTLRAYGNLIRHAREQGKPKDLERYVTDVQRYARSLVRQEKDKEYPMLYQRMAQIMTMGGFDAEAKEWAEAQAQ
ncbi:MAG: tetratricopeptide repeat protein [Gammaproteobacteria bacterium]|nr:tetratricopeptide repeat protein [Gammaproteobacteria bacterium]